MPEFVGGPLCGEIRCVEGNEDYYVEHYVPLPEIDCLSMGVPIFQELRSRYTYRDGAFRWAGFC